MPQLAQQHTRQEIYDQMRLMISQSLQGMRQEVAKRLIQEDFKRVNISALVNMIYWKDFMFSYRNHDSLTTWPVYQRKLEGFLSLTRSQTKQQ